MADITLEPINTLTVSSGGLADKIKNSLLMQLSKYGSDVHRDRLTRDLDARGQVIDIHRSVQEITVFMFDRNKSDVLTSAGVDKNTSVESSYRREARCYIEATTDVDEGDYILINYDAINDTHDEKYHVIEKEAHELNNTVIFYTLYLTKVVD